MVEGNTRTWMVGQHEATAWRQWLVSSLHLYYFKFTSISIVSFFFFIQTSISTICFVFLLIKSFSCLISFILEHNKENVSNFFHHNFCWLNWQAGIVRPAQFHTASWHSLGVPLVDTGSSSADYILSQASHVAQSQALKLLCWTSKLAAVAVLLAPYPSSFLPVVILMLCKLYANYR